jgi:catechol 2,3-dioxygenase-like lactoylglutathione lyase family enzyme
MSSTQLSSDVPTQASRTTALPMRLEVVVLPIADVDPAKSFYEGLGWRLDADVGGGAYRVVQMTPSGSTASIIFGTGVTYDEPGSIDSLLLAVDDIGAARDGLRSRGADVSEVFHDPGGGLSGGGRPGTEHRGAGPDPQRRSYASYASFRDPDGNKWMLQETTTRLPGRVEATDVATLAPLLHETSEHHDRFEKAGAGARLVGLVRRLPERPRAGKQPGSGRRGRRPLHGRGQERRRDVVRVIPTAI